MAKSVLYGIFLWGVIIQGYEFPENFLKCSLNDEYIDRCLDRAIENAFRLMGDTGIPSLNLPSIDPIGISNINIGAGGGSAVNLVQKYHNISFFGLSTVEVKESHYDQRRRIMSFISQHPSLRQEAAYNLAGKVLMFSVYGSGPSIISLKEPTLSHVAYFEEYTKRGRKYFRVQDYTVQFTITGAHFEFENMFNGDKKLAEMVLKVINENWQVVAEEVREGVQKAYAAICKNTANKIFQLIPVDEILPK